MKRQGKKKKSIFDIKLNLIMNPEMSKIDPKKVAPEKLARANESLKGM
jgi:hypothetical protein